MLILKGLLALLQITLLPGWIVLGLRPRPNEGILQRIIQLMPISLICNYLMVQTLVICGLYTAPIVLALILAEGIALIWIYRVNLLRSPTGWLADAVAAVKKEFTPFAKIWNEGFADGKTTLQSLLWVISGCMALSAVLWAFHLVRLRVGTIFSAWDTLFSWNRYAEILAEGQIPRIEGLYPQLIPANWSISYLITGGHIQLFNTLIPPLFFLLIQLMFFDLGFQKGESTYFIAAVIARYMMKKIMGDQLFDGYMDVPAACMVMLTVYTLLRSEPATPKERESVTLRAFIYACAAAVTKQSGVVALVLFPLLHRCILPRDGRESNGITRRQWIRIAAAFFLIPLPWYLFSLLNGGSGVAGSKAVATGIMDFNRQYEFSHKLYLARESLGIYQWVLLLSVMGLPLLPKNQRLPLFLLIVPQTLLWVMFTSYDARNVCTALPFAAWSCGWIIRRLYTLVLQWAGRVRIGFIPTIFFCVLCLALLILILPKILPDEKLRSIQAAKQRELFGARLNEELLYGVFGDTHGDGDILTDYPAEFLSGYADCCSMIDFTNEDHFESAIRDPSIRYLLKPYIFPTGAEETAGLFEKYRWNGTLTELGCSNGYYIPYCLYQIGETQ